MTYEPLHHKYRPQTFADLVGQDAIATTLSNAIALERIAPAYLFSGPRGTGKTSSARILAKSLNCLKSDRPTADPCGTCEVCHTITRGTSLDVIEIDAASNTGVDNIRELIERSQFAPVQCRYKIYCLDEVHMLSTAAFNALLKTLEEPPDQVVFVLATTDPQRVLPTIISRCQRFDFRRIPLHAMIEHLGYIARTEAIDITGEAIELIAQLSQGGLRDAESLLDQLSLLAEQIQIEHVWNLAGTVPEQDLLTLVQAIAARNPEQLLDSARQLLDLGREPLIVLQGLTSFYRDLLIAKTAPSRRDLVTITKKTWEELCAFVHGLSTEQLLRGQQHLRECEIQVKNTTQPRLWLEISLLGLMAPQETASAPPTVVLQAPITPQAASITVPTAVTLQPAAPAAPTHLESSSANSPGARSAPPTTIPAPQESAPAPSAAAQATVPPIKQSSANPASGETVETEASLTSSDSDRSISPAAMMDLQQAWQGLQKHLSPLTSALLVEHGHLAKLKNTTAVIGISTKPLAKIAQSRLEDIETAFEQFLQKKIKVSIEVLTKDGEAPTTQAPSPRKPEPPKPQPQGFSPTPYQPSPTHQTAPVEPPPATAPPPAVAPPASLSVAPTTAAANAPQEAWAIDDEATYAAQSFAQFFNGALVDLPEEAPEDNGASEPPKPSK